jgi:hypothetical protein
MGSLDAIMGIIQKVCTVVLLAIVVIILPGCCHIVHSDGGMVDQPIHAPQTAQELFMEMHVRDEVEMSRRISAAHILGSMESAEAWIVLSLTGDASLYYLRPDSSSDRNTSRRAIFQKFDRAVLATLMRSLPDKPRPVVLWALTEQLVDSEHGRYSSTEISEQGTKEYIEYITGPNREIARSILTRTTGVDYGYDKVRWRYEIARMLDDMKWKETGLE